MPERSRRGQEALEILLSKAINKDCQRWLENNVGTCQTEAVQFQESNLAELKQYDKEKLKRLLQEGKIYTAETSTKWEGWDVADVGGLGVNSTILSLFLHIVECYRNRRSFKLISCQAEVNGKRFITTSQVIPNDQHGNVTGIPYLVRQPEESIGIGGCRILPMDLKDTVQYEKKMNRAIGYASFGVSIPVILDVFKVLFGGSPDVNEVKDISPCQLIMVLLHHMDSAFDLQHIDGWISLLTAIGRYVFGDGCCDRLNDLSLDIEVLPSFTLAAFSSIIPLKLGFLSGESFVTSSLVSILKTKILKTKGIDRPSGHHTATTLLEATLDDESSTAGLKFISNEKIVKGAQNYTGGSVLDFFHEALTVHWIKNEPFPETKDYMKDLEERVGAAVDAIHEAGKHNPHIKDLIQRWQVGRCWVKDSVLPNQIGLDKDRHKKDIVDKFMKNCHNPKAYCTTNRKRGPREMSILIFILTDFSHGENAKHLLQFFMGRGDHEAGCLIPSGSNYQLEVGPFLDGWTNFHMLQRQCASMVLGAYLSHQKIKNLKDKKALSHRFARRLAQPTLKAVENYGLDVNTPDNWKDRYPQFYELLSKDCNKLARLYIIVTEIFSTVEEHAKNNQQCPLSYGEAITEEKLSKTQLDELDWGKVFRYNQADCSPFDVVGSLLNDGDDNEDEDEDEDGGGCLLGMIEQNFTWRKQTKSENKQKNQDKAKVDMARTIWEEVRSLGPDGVADKYGVDSTIVTPIAQEMVTRSNTGAEESPISELSSNTINTRSPGSAGEYGSGRVQTNDSMGSHGGNESSEDEEENEFQDDDHIALSFGEIFEGYAEGKSLTGFEAIKNKNVPPVMEGDIKCLAQVLGEEWKNLNSDRMNLISILRTKTIQEKQMRQLKTGLENKNNDLKKELNKLKEKNVKLEKRCSVGSSKDYASLESYAIQENAKLHEQLAHFPTPHEFNIMKEENQKFKHDVQRLREMEKENDKFKHEVQCLTLRGDNYKRKIRFFNEILGQCQSCYPRAKELLTLSPESPAKTAPSRKRAKGTEHQMK